MKKTEEILRIYESSKPNEELVEKFLNSKTRYAFGISPHTMQIAEKMRIDYCTDSRVHQNGLTYYDIPICILDDIPKDAVLLIIALNSYDVISAFLKDKGFHNTVSLRDLFFYDKSRTIVRLKSTLGAGAYEMLLLRGFTHTTDFTDDFIENADRYENVYNELSDDISKKAFEDVVLYKLTTDLKFTKNYIYNHDDHYFADFLELKEEGEVFADCGGCFGDTSEVFIKKCPKYKYIYIFEPTDAMEDAKALLLKHKNIEYIKKGVWDKTDTLKFNKVAYGGSAITDEGETAIDVVALDDVISQKVTFIKMDVEGAELSALKGAEKIIKRDRPRLAISVYHKHDDWWQIFEYVKSIMPDYRVYLRHYMPNSTETVMYFV